MSTSPASKSKPRIPKTLPYGIYSKYFTEADLQSLHKDYYFDFMREIAHLRLNLTRLLTRLRHPE